MNSKISKFTILFILILIASTLPAFANPLMPAEGRNLVIISFLVVLFVLPLFATILIEYAIAYIFLEKDLAKSIPLLKSLFIINLITFPITQILALFLASTFYLTEYSFYFAELFPFIVEFFLLRWQLNKLRKKEVLLSEVSNTKILIIDCTMNAVTFILGIIAISFM